MKSLAHSLIILFLLGAPCAALAEGDSAAGAPDAAAMEKPAAAPKKAVGSEVPKIEALSQKSMLGLGSMMVMFLLAVGAYKKVMEKRGGQPTVNQIQILSKKPVGPRHALLLVEVEGQRFFLAQTAETMNLIAPLEPVETFTETLNEFDDFVAARKAAQS
ncbi:MAG: flagellar biosynthetic protein FliO [Bdellovibrionota bacterium]